MDPRFFRPTTTFPETIPELVAWRSERARPGAPWLRFEDQTWTLAEVRELVDRFAAGLAARGVGKSHVVAMVLGNRPETLFTWFAANQLGAIAMPLNPAYKEAELRGVLSLVRPHIVVVGEELPAPVDDALRTLRTPLASTADLGSAEVIAVTPPELAPDDTAMLLVTSGTTGSPKVVMQTHRAYTLTAEAFPWWLGLDERDRILCALPLFHINAQAYSTMGALGCGAGLSLVPRFSASRFWEEIRRHRATEVNVVGAILHILLAAEEAPGDRGHGLRVCYSALALPEDKHRAFEERFGVRLTVGYGLSETPFGTIWARDTPPRYGTMGVLRQHPRLGVINEARVVTDDGVDAPHDEPGELWLSNPAVMSGYLGDPAQTSAAFVDDHWFKTGDLVRRDAQGNFTFVARKKDVLRRRGENVAAIEIEDALAAHEAVREAAVIGVPSDLGDDDIVGFVVPVHNLGRPIDPDELRAFVRERLADFKVPARIHVCDALPRTPTERVAKHLLREP